MPVEDSLGVTKAKMEIEAAIKLNDAAKLSEQQTGQRRNSAGIIFFILAVLFDVMTVEGDLMG